MTKSNLDFHPGKVTGTHTEKMNICQVWWYTTVIPAVWRLRQEDLKVKASLEYIMRPCLKKRN
jgi:hypothetical protein